MNINNDEFSKIEGFDYIVDALLGIGVLGDVRDDFAEICKASHDAGLYTKIATNGWFLETNPEFAREMHDTTVRRLADDVLKIYKNLK